MSVMKSVIVSAIAAVGLGLAPSAFAQQPPAAAMAGPIEVMRVSDMALTCADVADEAARLSASMGGDPDKGLFDRLGGVARAGASMVIPGAGLVIAGADAMTSPGRDREAAEVAAVRHRWYYLNGLYAGRDCMNAADAAGPTPASPADADPVVPSGS